jgi:ribosome maturation factor RimP
MIDKQRVEELVLEQLNAETEFIVEVSVSAANKILVLVDSDSGITIDRCVKISRAIEQNIDREQEDYELEVSSAGLSSPLKVVRQFQKNIGRSLDVILANGEKLKGALIAASDLGFTLEVEKMVKPEGKKRKERMIEQLELQYQQVKSAQISISFR